MKKIVFSILIIVLLIAGATSTYFVLNREKQIKCWEIFDDEECKMRADCDSEWTIDAGFHGGTDSFIRCNKLVLSDRDIEKKDLCIKSGGIWQKKFCKCENSQTEKELRENGRVFFHVRKGCMTEKQSCLLDGGDWNRWGDIEGCVRKCDTCVNCRGRVIDPDPEAKYSCIK